MKKGIHFLFPQHQDTGGLGLAPEEAKHEKKKKKEKKKVDMGEFT